MTARGLYSFLTLSLVVSIAITVVAALIAIVLPLVDEPLLTTWPIEFVANDTQPLQLDGSADWKTELNQGLLSIETTGLFLGLYRALEILIGWGMIVTLICYLRTVTGGVSSGKPFTTDTSGSLKRAGLVMIGLSIWLYMSTFIRFSLFVPDAMQLSEFKWTHINFAAESGMQFSIVPDLNIGLIVAGCFVLVLAKAFEIGLELQRDSDEII